MRRLSRLDKSLVRVRPHAPQPSPFLCTACGYQTSFSTSSRTPAQKKPLTERIRSKIWKTDQPPGQADPYGSASVLDRTKTPATTPRTRDDPVELDAEPLDTPPALPTETISSASLEDGYEPADSWDGLEELGGLNSDSGADEPFTGAFMPSQRIVDPFEATAALHRVIVEVFALEGADLPLSILSQAGVGEGENLTDDVQVMASKSGGFELHYQGAASQEKLLNSLKTSPQPLNSNPTESEQDIDADRSSDDPLAEIESFIDETVSHVNPTESEEDIAADRSDIDPLADKEAAASLEAKIESWGETWLRISLDNAEIKFAVFKRVMQLTGYRIPDSQMRFIKSVSDVFRLLVTPPKPDKLFDVLASTPELDLPNIRIHPSRYTPINKQQDLGRWKLIEKELMKRGLPVTGHKEVRGKFV